MKPVISIIMPVYNSENYLAEAIKSIQNQTFNQFELILVNDGSTDRSGEICDQFSKKDSRIHVVHKENGGICAARNTGISHAVGDFVGFMDNDDYYNPNLLHENYKLLMKHKADWIKFGKIEVLVQNGKKLTEKKTRFEDGIYGEKQILKELLTLRSNDVMTFVWDSLFRRSILIDNNLFFDEKFKMGNEDIDFCEQYAEFSNKLVVNSKHYYTHYTRLGISTSSKYSEEKIKSYMYLLRKSNKRYSKYKISIHQNKEAYSYIILKQIIVSICQKLNDAGNLISKSEKKAMLEEIKNSPELSLFMSFDKVSLASKSKKLFLYNKLFRNEKYTMLLFMDKISRDIVYSIRSLKKKR